MRAGLSCSKVTCGWFHHRTPRADAIVCSGHYKNDLFMGITINEPFGMSMSIGFLLIAYPPENEQVPEKKGTFQKEMNRIIFKNTLICRGSAID